MHTSFGGVEVEQTSYRKDSKSPPVVAMAKALGLVEGGYTPKAAKIACLLTALVVREDVEKIRSSSEVGPHDSGTLRAAPRDSGPPAASSSAPLARRSAGLSFGPLRLGG